MLKQNYEVTFKTFGHARARKTSMAREIFWTRTFCKKEKNI